MAWLPRINCLATEHLDGNVRANYGTQGAPSAFTVFTLFLFSIFGWMITLDVELVAYPDRPLGARLNTESAALAEFRVDPNESLLQRSLSRLAV